MAQFKSKYLADAALNWFRGTTYPAAISTAYLALFTAAPTARDGTGGTEVTGGAYARVAIPNADLNAPTTSGSGVTSIEQIISNALLTFAQASANWGTVVGMGLYDGLTGGNFLEYGDLTTAQTVSSGNTFQVPSGDVVVQEK